MRKNTMPVFFALSFVWFTTHFGGGFASGVQLNSYFIKYGIFSLIMPVISQALLGLVFYYAWTYSKNFELFDYRSWTDHFYGSTRYIMSNVYELIFNMTLVIATAVAFATGGATIEKVFGTPFLVNTIGIAAVIFLLTIFGANMVRKVATYIAIAIIVSMLIIFIPNIVVFWPQLMKNITNLKSISAGSTGGIWPAIWKMLVYAGFQSCALGAYISHVSALKDKDEVKKAALWGTVINGGLMFITTLGLLSFYGQELTSATVPTLVVATMGVGSSWMKPLVSILIIIGAVSTGVNLIYGVVNRIVEWLGRNESTESGEQKQKTRSISVSIIYIFATWSVSQLGLIPLISKGYGSVGVIAIFTIIIPLLLRGTIGRKFSKSEEECVCRTVVQMSYQKKSE